LFFGSGIPFAIYTAWMLLLVWIWAITVAAGTEPAKPGLDFKRLRFALLQS